MQRHNLAIQLFQKPAGAPNGFRRSFRPPTSSTNGSICAGWNGWVTTKRSGCLIFRRQQLGRNRGCRRRHQGFRRNDLLHLTINPTLYFQIFKRSLKHKHAIPQISRIGRRDKAFADRRTVLLRRKPLLHQLLQIPLQNCAAPLRSSSSSPTMVTQHPCPAISVAIPRQRALHRPHQFCNPAFCLLPFHRVKDFLL